MASVDARRAKLLPVQELIRRLDKELARAGELAAVRGTDARLAQSVHAAQGWATALRYQWGRPQLVNGAHSAAQSVPGPYSVSD